jgi:CO dehydrogenase maturation factor
MLLLTMKPTSNKIDLLLFVSNYSLKGLKTVKKLSEMVDDLGIDVSSRYILVSRTPEELNGKFKGEVEKLGIPYIGNLVDDALIEEADINGTSLFDLPDSSLAVKGIESMLEKLIQ